MVEERRNNSTSLPAELSQLPAPNLRVRAELSFVSALKEILSVQKSFFLPFRDQVMLWVTKQAGWKIFWLLAVRTGISCTERLAVVGDSLKKDSTEARSKGERLLISGAWGLTPFHLYLPAHIPQWLPLLRCHTHPCMRTGYTRGKKKKKSVQQKKAESQEETVDSGPEIHCQTISLGW